MPPERQPPPDLPLIVGTAAAQIIAAIPLKPAARIVPVNPAFLSPVGKRLGSVDAEEVDCRIVALPAEFSVLEPARWKLRGTVGHVLSPKHAKLKHLFGRELR